MRILHIDVDSLRPDHLGCYGYLRNTSPNVDQLATEATRFANVYASDGPCLPSRTAMWSGRFGFNTGVVGHGGTAAQPFIEGPSRIFRDKFGMTGWMRCLRDLGFYTATISSFGERHSAWHWYAGFNEMHNPGTGGQETANIVAPLAIDWLKRRGNRDNWYLHVNFWDPHTPYNTPADYSGTFNGQPLPQFYNEAMRQRCWDGYGPHSAQEPHDFNVRPEHARKNPRMPLQIDCMDSLRRWVDGYDIGVRYFDDHLGQMFDALRELGIWAETAVIVSADHGENLGELNVWGDHQTADQITCRVPLIVRWPGITDGGGEDDALHYQFDWAATMIELLGGAVPKNWDGHSFAPAFVANASMGRDFLVLSQGAWAVQRAVRFQKFLCMFTWHAGYKQLDPVMLFDLQSDPHEESNIASVSPELVHRARSHLAEWEIELAGRTDSNVDPLRTVLREGGPFHCRAELPAYVQRLRETGRGQHAEFLLAQCAKAI